MRVCIGCGQISKAAGDVRVTGRFPGRALTDASASAGPVLARVKAWVGHRRWDGRSGVETTRSTSCKISPLSTVSPVDNAPFQLQSLILCPSRLLICFSCNQWHELGHVYCFQHVEICHQMRLATCASCATFKLRQGQLRR